MHLSGGNCHDAPQGRISIEHIGNSYSGVPILMDRAYEGDKTRELCQSFGHKPIVPPKKNRINPWEYDHELYKQRNIIERLFRWLKAFRRICTSTSLMLKLECHLSAHIQALTQYYDFSFKIQTLRSTSAPFEHTGQAVLPPTRLCVSANHSCPSLHLHLSLLWLPNDTPPIL